jgi:hypothetical protein
MTESTYIPGVCNIDQAGVRRRTLEGMIVLVAGMITLPILYYFKVSALWRYVAAFGFSYGSLLGFLQAKNKFCVVNGLLGYSEELGRRTPLSDATAKRVDKRRTINELAKLTLYSALLGLLGVLPI